MRVDSALLKNGILHIVFTDNEFSVEKTVRLPDVYDDYRVVEHSIARRIREANRDCLFNKYGDKWPEDIGKFWTGLSEEEEGLVLDVYAALKRQ